MATITLGHAGRSAIALDLPKLLPTRLLITANSGGGKSWLLRRIAEQLFGKVQVLIIDPEGEFPSLREKYGYVLVGKGGETPADVRSARLLAEKLLELRASAVCDLYDAFRGKPLEQRAWVRGFLEALIDSPKKLWHPMVVIVDEAHKFCPQEAPKGADMREREIIAGCKEAMIALCSAGRKRGFCPAWATQRLAKLDKDASSELFNRLVGMMIEDVDIDRAIDLMSVAREDKHGFRESLRTLEPGYFYAFGRAISKKRVLLKVGEVTTTHPDVSSGVARYVESPPAPEKVKALLPKLADLPKQAEDQAKDMASARARITELERQLRARPVQIEPKVEKVVERLEIPIFKDGELSRLEKAIATMSDVGAQIQGTGQAIASAMRTAVALCVPVPSGREMEFVKRRLVVVPPQLRQAQPIQSPAPGNGGLPKAERRILTVLAQDISRFQEIRMPEPKPVYSVPPSYEKKTAVTISQATSQGILASVDWLHCRICGHPITPVFCVSGKTAMLRTGMVIYAARLACPNPGCGGEANFMSEPISALHLRKKGYLPDLS